MRRHVALAAVAALAFPVSAFAQNSAAPAAPATARPKLAQLLPDSLERARRYATWLLTSRSDSLFASLDSAGRAQFGSMSTFDEITADLAARAGAEDRVIQERWVTRLGKRQYWRTSKYSASEEPIIVRLVMLPTGQLAGIGVNPLSQAPPIDP
jgi:hypothetical protein